MFVYANVKVRFQWTGVHQWPNASGRHEYLKYPHRHVFKGTATIQVFHNDRDIEFFDILDFIHDQLKDYEHLGDRSCEWVAQDLITRMFKEVGSHRNIEVEITEDGENGAVVLWDGSLEEGHAARRGMDKDEKGVAT